MQTTARKGNTLLGSVIKRTNIRKTWPLWLMMLIPLGALILFQYVPMAGLRLAFVDLILLRESGVRSGSA